MVANTSKRLAKNTAFMYLRMGILMLISLYTSRIVLEELGIDDYGIYNLVGSVVGMFTSLKILFSSSTQRFLNYEMGRGKEESLQLVFNISIIVHLLICLVFVMLVESVGIWFLESKINVAPDRHFAASVVFHLSVFTAVIGVMTTPYDAVVIAHERMDFYAYVSIFEGIMRLLIVTLLAYLPYDKLITYGVLQMLVSVIVRLINVIYCKRRFLETHTKKMWNKQYFKQMMSFACWNFLGTTVFTLYHNGLNMILNVFGGTVVNAARGIAYQINNVLLQFINNVTVVINPYCIKLWSAGEKEKAFKMIFFSSKILFIIQLCLLTPLYYLTPEILQIWLGQVPEYSVTFIRLILIYSLVRSLHPSLDLLFKSCGNIKNYQIAEGCLQFLPLLVSYIILKQGAPYASAFVIAIIGEIINMMVVILLAHKIAGLDILQYSIKVLTPCSFLFGGMIILFYVVSEQFDVWYVKFAIATCVMCAEMAYWYILAINKWEREQLLGIMKKK